MMFRDKRNERLGLLTSVIIFGLVGIVQLWRALAHVSLQFGGHAVPIWLSAIVGVLALLMAFWLGAILRRSRPVL